LLLPRASRVVQRDWDRPQLEVWLATLDKALDEASEPAVLIAHSLGCALVVHAAARRRARGIRAALLVAPADVDSPMHTPSETRSFAPLPRAPLGFPATVVASDDDPYMTSARARAFAMAWGAELVDAGRAGHLNAASGLGDWTAGLGYLDALVRRA
jgi:predicted alpha/beta hydrolase family esterase